MHEAALACPSCGKPNTVSSHIQAEPSSWLSFNGRISRKTYWLHYALPLAALSAVSVILDGMIGASGALLGLVVVLSLVPQFAASAKRLHDRDRSAWFVLITLIPLLNLWYLIEVGFLRGTSGQNRFGVDPIPGRQFTRVAVSV